MSITHLREHLSCKNYYSTNMSPLEIFDFNQGEVRKREITHSSILFVLEGAVDIASEKHGIIELEAGQFVLRPAHSKLNMFFKETSQLLICRFELHTQLCGNYPLNFLTKETTSIENKSGILEVRGRLNNYLHVQKGLLTEGMRCKMFIDMKIKELFHLFKIYYTKQELADFFRPILSRDVPFSTLVYNNMMLVKTVDELAAICNYSLSGFVKRFTKTFGTSPYKWIKQQKAARILHDIKERRKSLKEICREYEFASISYFHAFCKREFGITPGQLRENEYREFC